MTATRYRPETAPAIPGLVHSRLLDGSREDVEVHLYRGLRPRQNVTVTVSSSHRLPVAAASAALRHPFIVPVLSAGVTDCGRSYVVTAHYPGPDLAARAASRVLAVEEVLKIGIQVASAVQAAHHVGIVHGNIGPASLLVDGRGRLGLSGLGVTARLDAGAGAELAADIQSDLSCLGATLWQLLVGRPPSNGAAADGPPPPRTGRGDVPESLERLLARWLATEPGDRPASAAQLAGELQEIERELGLSCTEFVLPDGPDLRPDPEPEPEPEPEPAEPESAQPAEPEDESAQPAVVPPARTDAEEAAGGDRVPPARPATAGAPSTVVLAVAAAVVAVTVAGLPFAFRHRGADPTRTPPRTAAAPAAAPGPATVLATAGRGAVGFGWTYPRAQPGDSYRWRSVSGAAAASGAANDPALTLHGRPGTKVCLQVSVSRAGRDGSIAAAVWSPAVCGVVG